MGNAVYDKAIFDVICKRMSAGESLRAICKDDGMPAPSTVRLWVLQDQEYAERYARARSDLYEHWADEILDIADDGKNDFMEREKEAGRVETVPDHEHINRSRLRVDSRKWLLSKLVPKQYGDKQTLEHTGPDGGAVQVAMDQEQLKSFILAVTHDCPTCRVKAAAKLLEMEMAGNGNPSD